MNLAVILPRYVLKIRRGAMPQMMRYCGISLIHQNILVADVLNRHCQHIEIYHVCITVRDVCIGSSGAQYIELKYFFLFFYKTCKRCYKTVLCKGRNTSNLSNRQESKT